MSNSDFYFKIYDFLYKNGYHAGRKNFMINYVKYLKENYKFKTVLDVGCSQGIGVQTFVNKGKRAWGIDISEQAIKNAERLNIQNCRQASATDIPFKDSSFDLVVSCDVIEHMKPEDVKVAINEMIRVSKQFIFIKVCPGVENNRIWINKIHESNISDIHDLHLTIKTFDEWLQLFLDTGKVSIVKVNRNKEFFILRKLKGKG